jgi:hypothetical protein
MTPEAIKEFWDIAGFGPFLIFPNDMKFAIFSADYFYRVLAGPRDFVRKAVGCSFRTARKLYKEYADKARFPGLKEILHSLVESYDPFYDHQECGPAHSGEEVLEEITDPNEILNLSRPAEGIVERNNELSLDWLQSNRWKAIHMPEETDCAERHAEWIAEAAQESGCSECFALPSEPKKNRLPYYRLNMNTRSLMKLFRESSGYGYILITEDRRFVTLRLPIGVAMIYFLIAGPPSFVRKAAGCSAKTARRTFLHYIDISMPAYHGDLIEDGLKRYEPFSHDT